MPSAVNVITIMAILILGTFIMNAPKELPREVFNITVDGKTKFFTKIAQGECARHINTAREVLLLTYSKLEVQGMLSAKFIDIKCIKQDVTIPTE